MRAFLLALVLTLVIPLSTFSYPTIGARVRELSGQPDIKIVDFTIRNTLDEYVDGYFYIIHLTDAYGQRILSAGQIIQGYRDIELPPGGSERERILVPCRGTPVRVEVEVMLIIPAENGTKIVQ